MVLDRESFMRRFRQRRLLLLLNPKNSKVAPFLFFKVPLSGPTSRQGIKTGECVSQHLGQTLPNSRRRGRSGP
jgi:hypothetical protein